VDDRQALFPVPAEYHNLPAERQQRLLSQPPCVAPVPCGVVQAVGRRGGPPVFPVLRYRRVLHQVTEAPVNGLDRLAMLHRHLVPDNHVQISEDRRVVPHGRALYVATRDPLQVHGYRNFECTVRGCRLQPQNLGCDAGRRDRLVRVAADARPTHGGLRAANGRRRRGLVAVCVSAPVRVHRRGGVR
jgi:hypothetical protein